MIFAKQSEQKAIVYKENEYTYNDLLRISSDYASALTAQAKPSKVLIYADNSDEWVLAFYGCIRTGATIVPVDAQSTTKELAYILRDCTPECIITDEAKKDTVNKAMEIANITSTVLTANDIKRNPDTPVTDIVVEEMERTMLLIYTSGTTGSPKGVMISVKNIEFNVNSVSVDVPIFTAERNVMVLLPLHHAFPLMGTMIGPLSVGATIYIAESLSAESILGTLKRGKIAIFVGVPRLYEILSGKIMETINSSIVTKLLYKTVQLLNSQKISKVVFKKVHDKFGGHLLYLVSGGASLPKEIGSIFKTLGFSVLEGYGMTETAPMICFTRPWNIRIGYVGEALKGVQVKIDENGEVCVKGDNVMQGYYNRPEETAQVIKDGWLHTGDMGEIDNNYIKITGRIKDIIVTANGKNINPEEVEQEIMKESPCIKEIGVFLHNGVLQCIIVPQMVELRDKSLNNMNEVLRMEIEKYNQSVAQYKRIKNIHIYSGELPKTRLMKIQRFKLQSLIEQNNEETKTETETPRSEVYLRLKKFIDSETGCNANENDHFEIDLAIDSLGKIALLTYVEQVFKISITEMQLDELNTLNKLTAYVEQNQTEGTINTNISWKEILSTKKYSTKVPKAGIIQAICSHFVRFLMHAVYMFNYRKHGNFEMPKQPCIIVANHRSALDGYFITSKLRPNVVKKTFFFAKEKHLHSRFAHFMARKNNVILMDINKNVRDSLQQMAAVLQAGKNVIIFPEGTRSNDNKLKTFKDSFAILSKELNVPVVPVAISGSERAVFNKIYIPRPFAKISIDFLTPVIPKKTSTIEGIRNNVVMQISNRLHDYQMQKKLKLA
ncbi:MAG: AMP-binding protein [Bacteroidales bacterium]|nr:AMP-binding protein [Bacteroidales bacterium]